MSDHERVPEGRPRERVLQGRARDAQPHVRRSKLLSDAENISAQTGKPLAVIALALGKAYDGNATALQRIGIIVAEGHDRDGRAEGGARPSAGDARRSCPTAQKQAYTDALNTAKGQRQAGDQRPARCRPRTRSSPARSRRAARRWPARWQIFEAQWEEIKVQVGEAILPLLTAALGAVVKALNWLGENKSVQRFFADLHTKAEQLVVWFQTNWPKIKPVLLDLFHALQTVWKEIAQPILGLLVVALGKVVVAVADHWPQIRATIITVWNGAKPVLATMRDVLEFLANRVIKPMGEIATTAFGGISKAIKTVAGPIKAAVDVLVAALGPVISTMQHVLDLANAVSSIGGGTNVAMQAVNKARQSHGLPPITQSQAQQIEAGGGNPATAPAPAAGGGGAGGGASGGSGGGGGAPAAHGAGVHASPAAAQSYAASRLSSYGWSSSEMPSLIQLWNNESGWRWSARNAKSGALGIPQELGHAVPSDYADNAFTQVDWGLGYIKSNSHFNSPSTALSFWNAQSPNHWYHAGGVVPGRGSRDSVPAMLTPGEFVLTPTHVQRLGGMRSLINRIGGLMPNAPSGRFMYGGEPYTPAGSGPNDYPPPGPDAYPPPDYETATSKTPFDTQVGAIQMQIAQDQAEGNTHAQITHLTALAQAYQARISKLGGWWGEAARLGFIPDLQSEVTSDYNALADANRQVADLSAPAVIDQTAELQAQIAQLTQQRNVASTAARSNAAAVAAFGSSGDITTGGFANAFTAGAGAAPVVVIQSLTPTDPHTLDQAARAITRSLSVQAGPPATTRNVLAR
jgi:hypothetical protein